MGTRRFLNETHLLAMKIKKRSSVITWKLDTQEFKRCENILN